jgi:hypothetical protein
MLAPRDPIFQARKRLLADKRLRLDEKVEMIFRAWNSSRNKRGVSKIELCGRLPKLVG